MTTTHTAAANGKLPLPARAPRGITSPAPKSADAKSAAAIAAITLPAGTMIGGIDCGGMTDDPKKEGIPVYLQSQNRRELSAEQKQKIADLQKKLAADKRAKTVERTKMAKQLGMSPTEMRKAGASLKSDAEKTEGKKAKSASSSKPAAKRKPSDKARYDWNGAREAAAKGKVPAAPDFSAETHKRYREPLAEVVALVKARDLDGLTAYRVQGKWDSAKALKRYREIAIIALKASK